MDFYVILVLKELHQFCTQCNNNNFDVHVVIVEIALCLLTPLCLQSFNVHALLSRALKFLRRKVSSKYKPDDFRNTKFLPTVYSSKSKPIRKCAHPKSLFKYKRIRIDLLFFL